MSFSITEGGLDFPLPLWRKIRQRFDAPREADIRGAVAREMAKLDRYIHPGMTVAIGSGSRGLARIAEITRAVVDELKRRGAVPFIVPAMGSHGGGTPEGQMAVLAGYGITPKTMGVEFRPSMETVLLGKILDGHPVYFSKEALAADAVFPINRVKLHTDFHGPVESGLSKMLVLGYGKHKGAAQTHARGFSTFHELVPAAAAYVLSKVNVLGGLASIENGHEEIALLEAVPGPEIPVREPDLMAVSRRLMPRIPFTYLDVLIVDYLGKEISGGGMDANVTGRYIARHLDEPEKNPQKIAVLRLTETTHGNATGLGMADVTTKAVVENIDYQRYWTNIVSSTELPGGRTPIWMQNDRQAIALGLLTCNRVNILAPRLVRIRSTLHLEEMWVAEALWQAEGKARPDLEPLSGAQEIAFTSDGNLADLPLPAFRHGRKPWE